MSREYYLIVTPTVVGTRYCRRLLLVVRCIS